MKTESGVVFGDCPRPVPKDGEVLIEVACTGLCRTDLYVANGALPVLEGRVLGHEFSGVISQLGPGVEDSWLSRAVAVFPWVGCGECGFCQQGAEKLQVFCPKRRFLGLDLDGSFAQYIAVPLDRCFEIGGLDFQAAAYAEPVAAALGVKRTEALRAERVGVLGENRIASLTSRLLKHLRGAPLCQNWEDDSLEVVVESGGQVEEAMVALAPGGTLILKSRPPGHWPWPTRLQVEKEITVVGVGYGSFEEALVLLREQPQLFQDLWEAPRPLSQWQPAFEQAKAGAELKKMFFCP